MPAWPVQASGFVTSVEVKAAEETKERKEGRKKRNKKRKKERKKEGKEKKKKWEGDLKKRGYMYTYN